MAGTQSSKTATKPNDTRSPNPSEMKPMIGGPMRPRENWLWCEGWRVAVQCALS